MMDLNHKKVIIILPRQLGDILLGTSLARALKYVFPHVHISWLSHPMGKQILKNHPFIDEVFYSKGHLREDFFLFKKLRQYKYDVVIDAMAIPRTAGISRFIGAPIRISFRTRHSRNIFYTHLIDRKKLDEGYLGFTRLKLLESLGIKESSIPIKEKTPFLPIETKDFIKAKAVIENLNVNKPFILLSPTHRRPVRQWPPEHFVLLALRLIDRGYTVVWLWGPGEDQFVKKLHSEVLKVMDKDACENATSIFPPLLTLRETAALASFSECFVGNSNGLSHIAVAGGAKSVQLHGSTLSKVWTFPDPNRHVGVDAGCMQSCLGKNTCLNAAGRCLEKVSVESVFNQVTALIG